MTGQSYIEKILNYPNPERIRQVFRMPKETFLALCKWTTDRNLLSPTRATLSFPGISVEEQIAIFLKVVSENASNRTVQERFQHSGDTISRHFHSVLEALLVLYTNFVLFPSTAIPPEITKNPKMFPYFKDCIGAIDGTHILARVRTTEAVRFRNRKGAVSQNVLAACKFNLQFCYILAGWEGSAHDSRVLQHALSQDFIVPDGKYFLADAGYGL